MATAGGRVSLGEGPLPAGTAVGGFRIRGLLHEGGMARLYAVDAADAAAPAPFPLLMKVPKLGFGSHPGCLVGFEVERMILGRLRGPHAPALVASGDEEGAPWLVMERIEGEALADRAARAPLEAGEVARLTGAVAAAVHDLHRQNVIHFDLKPANVLFRADGTAVPIDFGLARHGELPDLVEEEFALPAGTGATISPEQLAGNRRDPRSDLFALGVIAYQLATGKLPFGAPTTRGGMRRRLYIDPPPPRALKPGLPPWLQEVILRCLEPEADQRHPSAAHLAFDLSHPEQVQITARGQRTQGPGAWRHLKRWFKAAGMHYQPSPLPARQIDEVPIVMVAIPHGDVTDATLYSLRQAVGRSLGIRPGARLACVTVISTSAANHTDSDRSETSVHRHHLTRLKQWTEGLDLSNHSVSYHVLESNDVAQALVRYAEGNQVSMLILGAATHGLHTQRVVSTIPIRVARDAPCTVLLVKQSLPFAQLSAEYTE